MVVRGRVSHVIPLRRYPPCPPSSEPWRASNGWSRLGIGGLLARRLPSRGSFVRRRFYSSEAAGDREVVGTPEVHPSRRPMCRQRLRASLHGSGHRRERLLCLAPTTDRAREPLVCRAACHS